MGFIYRYRDATDNVIKYVGIVWGKSRSLRQRLNEHASYDDWCRNGNWIIEYMEDETFSKTDLEYVESHLISLYGTGEYFNKLKSDWGTSAFIPDLEDRFVILEERICPKTVRKDKIDWHDEIIPRRSAMVDFLNMNVANGRNVAYVRSSPFDPNGERQLDVLSSCDIDRLFIESVPVKSKERPQFQELLLYIKEGDTVYVSELASLALFPERLLEAIGMLLERKTNFVSVKEGWDVSSPAGLLKMELLASVTKFEREISLERQREGIEIAKRKGKYKGRKKIVVPNFGEYYDRYMRREISKSGIAKELNVNRETVDRIMRDYLAELERKKGAG